MPITPFLQNEAFGPEVLRAMGTALDRVCSRMNINRTPQDLVAQLVAHRIIELARSGEDDPDVLCQRTLMELNAYLSGPSD